MKFFDLLPINFIWIYTIAPDVTQRQDVRWKVGNNDNQADDSREWWS